MNNMIDIHMPTYQYRNNNFNISISHYCFSDLKLDLPTQNWLDLNFIILSQNRHSLWLTSYEGWRYFISWNDFISFGLVTIDWLIYLVIRSLKGSWCMMTAHSRIFEILLGISRKSEMDAPTISVFSKELFILGEIQWLRSPSFWIP